MRLSVSIFALLLFASCVRHDRTPPADVVGRCTDAPRIDVLHHDIDLSLSLAPPSLGGRGTLRIKTRRPTRQLALDANVEITEVATEAGPQRFTLDGGRLCAELPQPLPAGAELHLRLSWRVPTHRKTPSFTKDDVWAGYHTASWMPTVQDSAQRATLALRVAAPPDLKVAASGFEQPTTMAGSAQGVHTFIIDRPTPPFLYAFAAGHFDEATLDVEGLELRALGPAGADLKAALVPTEFAYRFLSTQLASHLPMRRYTQVFVSGSAAQEAVGLALMSKASLDDLQKDPKEDWVFTHELSHQWFGWLVPCADFADFWLNEGFATFMVAAIKETRWGRPAYDREVQLWRTRSAKVHEQGRDMPVALSNPAGPPAAPPTDAQLQPRGITYARGALVLHRLRNELGDPCFWTGLRAYVKQHTGLGARSEDLRKALETSCNQDLRPFFARWVYGVAADL